MQSDVISQKYTLEDRLELIESVFDTEELITRHSQDTKMIAKYYRINRLPYKFFHSKDGFVHMGISRDLMFHEDDFYEQGRMINEYIQGLDTSVVLELAAGKGTTIRYLATQNKAVQFYGIDLPYGQLAINSKSQPNLKLSYGDFHDLKDIADESIDIVYVIEALCYAIDRPRVISEVRRVLKPNGIFIVFDGYTTKSRNAMTDTERYASDLTFSSMMVNTANLHYSAFKNELSTSGFSIEKDEDLSKFVIPSMKRLENGSLKLLKSRWKLRLLTKLFSNVLTANVVAGALMPITTEMGIHQYGFTVAKK